jgi:hypothetical protein
VTLTRSVERLWFRLCAVGGELNEARNEKPDLFEAGLFHRKWLHINAIGTAGQGLCRY